MSCIALLLKAEKADSRNCRYCISTTKKGSLRLLIQAKSNPTSFSHTLRWHLGPFPESVGCHNLDFVLHTYQENRSWSLAIQPRSVCTNLKQSSADDSPHWQRASDVCQRQYAIANSSLSISAILSLLLHEVETLHDEKVWKLSPNDHLVILAYNSCADLEITRAFLDSMIWLSRMASRSIAHSWVAGH